ncbi:MAG TPA: DNA sulfur modification protein DndD [Pirellulales bacterium]|nr:DNA sulfur modification protein DndD [Pirellulales bacterium]
MLLEELTLNNFCLYKGRQTFALAPGRKNGRARPIVLCSGINGGGKTTLLDAIQLALYGGRARCSKRAALAYDDFLRECIHRAVEPGEGASVGLSFRYAAEGEEHQYDVRRAWQVKEGKLRETLHVSRDGQHDRWLSDNWQQLVEELIPLGISQLFFFDAEKIRFLADDETGNHTLGAAIKSLLGLDLAERLIADATVIEGRLAKRMVADEDRAELDELEKQLAEAEAELKRLVVERASLENDVQRASHEARLAEDRFANVGGEHWQEHEARKARQHVLKARQDELEGELVELAAGELPLAMVADLRQSVVEQDRRERHATEALVVERLLEERDRNLLAVMEEQKVQAKALKLVRELMEADRRQRAAVTATDAERRLALSEQAHALVVDLENHALPKRLDDARRLLEQLRQVQHELEEIERSLTATPAEERIKDVAAEFKQASKRATLLEEEARRQDARIATAGHARDELRGRQHKLLRKRVQQEIREEETVRMAQLAARTKTTMQEFLRRATAAKIDRLSKLVSESFRFLLRKQTLVEQIMIDPQTFAITLFGSDGQAISKQRLGASMQREGDRHIFPGRLARRSLRQHYVVRIAAGKMSQSPCGAGARQRAVVARHY